MLGLGVLSQPHLALGLVVALLAHQQDVGVDGGHVFLQPRLCGKSFATSVASVHHSLVGVLLVILQLLTCKTDFLLEDEYLK